MIPIPSGVRVSQAPAPFHAIPRGWAGPSLLAMIMGDCRMGLLDSAFSRLESAIIASERSQAFGAYAGLIFNVDRHDEV